MRRDGTAVKCFICGANHYKNNCPNKKYMTDNDTPATDTMVQHVTLGDDDWKQDFDRFGLMFLTKAVEIKY